MKITKRQFRRIVLETRKRLADNPYAYVGDDVGPGEIPAEYHSKLFSALGMLGFETGLDPERKDFEYDILDGLIAAERQLKKDGFENPSVIIDFIKPRVADIFRKEPAGAGIPRTDALVAAIPFDVFNDAAGGPFGTRAMDKRDPSVMFDEEEEPPPMIDEAKIKITKKQLKRIIQESVHSQMDGELTNLVFLAAQEVNEKHADITVQDVVDEIKGMDSENRINYSDPRLQDYFIEVVREMTYEDVVDRMMELVELGELTGGYEDFYSMRETK